MKYTACFTGHRPKSWPCGFNEQHPACLKIKHQLKRLIVGLIEKGNVLYKANNISYRIYKIMRFLISFITEAIFSQND